MYILTIVFLTSQVMLQSAFFTAAACEDAASFARGFDAGSQAVQTARCEFRPVPAPAPR